MFHCLKKKTQPKKGPDSHVEVHHMKRQSLYNCLSLHLINIPIFCH